MLVLTEDAAAMVRRVTGPGGGGLRIAPRGRTTALSMALAHEPRQGDVVIRTDEAEVYLEQTVASRLHDHVLDARSGASGSAFFFA